MTKKNTEDKDVPASDQQPSDGPQRRRRGFPQRLHTSPYLLKRLRSYEEAAREAADKEDEEE